MLGDAKSSRGVRPDDEEHPDLESAPSKGGQSQGNIDELVSSFLQELSSLSDGQSEAPPTPEPAYLSADFTPEPVPDTRLAAKGEVEALPLESEAATEDLNLELARALDELERIKSQPDAPPDFSGSGRTGAARDQAVKVPPPSPEAWAPVKTAPPAAFDAAAALAAPLRAKPDAEPAAMQTPAREPTIFKWTSPPRNAPRRIGVFAWVLVPAVLLIGAAVGYHFITSGTSPAAGPAEPPASAVNQPAGMPVSAAPAKPEPVKSQDEPARDSVSQQAAKTRNTAVTPARRSQPDSPGAATAKPEQNAGRRSEADRADRQPAVQPPAVQQPVAENPPAVSTAPPTAGAGGSTAKVNPAGDAAGTIPPILPLAGTPEKLPVVPPAAAAASNLTPPPAESRAANTAEPERKPLPAPAGTTAAPPATTYKAPEPAVAVRKVTPVYPASARRFRVWGTVLLNVEVDQTGKVTRASAVSGPALLRPAAEEALMKWQFKPATVNGVNQRSTVSVSVTFSPED